MIDLAKPIRSKGLKKPARIRLLIDDGQPALEWITLEQLEKRYENIPEEETKMVLQWTNSGEHPTPPDIIEFHAQDRVSSKYSIMSYRRERP